MAFEDTLSEIEKAVEEMMADAEAAASGERGWKSAHKRLRKASSALSKLLPQLRKDSIEAERA
jgi:exonuclease VII small subunit